VRSRDVARPAPDLARGSRRQRRAVGFAGRDARKEQQTRPRGQVLLAEHVSYRSRAALIERYGTSAQRLNGWRFRASHPLPQPTYDRTGQPYWHVLQLVAWERTMVQVVMARAEVRRIRMIVNFFDEL
jgi:hypothetical protein